MALSTLGGCGTAATTSLTIPRALQVFTVHESTMDFRITVSVNVSMPASDAAAAPLPAPAQVHLTPAQPKGRTPDKRVRAQLVGDLLPYTAFPVLTSQRLVMPRLLDLSSLRPEDWMLLDPSAITMDGSECNKIGVGFSAFKCALCQASHASYCTVCIPLCSVPI